MQEYHLHIDLDAFFASVEQLDFPEYRGKPVIVGGLPTDRRSVVSTCSYEARAFGVHSAMPTAKAFQLCPQGIYVRGRMERYQEKSREIMQALGEFSPDVQQMSIDEAFLDLTGTQRLLGKSEDVVMRLKEHIFEKTGLTVSAGLASSKYIAKIASGMSKPNGFFVVQPGDEESFMLSLPLKKIWGIGSKTRIKLNNAGLFTVQEVHNTSLQTLKSLIGNAAGAFLYNAVRGKEVHTFDEEPKSHSISSESTFSFDLTDMYTIETHIMLLSQDVFFRAVHKKRSAKTVSVKIRYEDFTTVSIQETVLNSFTTANELNERAFALLRKKYEYGRGIRLLGVALQNVQVETAKQGELFDTGSEKQEKLEKALIALREKHPDIQVQKARLLKQNKSSSKKNLSMLFAFLMAGLPFILSFFAQPAFAQLPFFEVPLPLQEETPPSLFQYTVDDQNIEFTASGSWEATISSEAEIRLEEDDPLQLSLTPFIFQQKTDLSLWFMLNKQWYFEANFIDGYNQNSLAAGYVSDDIIKHVRIGNKGILFPNYYDSVIGEGDIIAPGIMAEFSNNNWAVHSAIRYESAQFNEKTYSGLNEIGSNSIGLQNWEQGRFFALPSSEIASDIKDVYVEDDDSQFAEFTDSQNRKYRKLEKSEYFIRPLQGMLSLNEKAEGRILLTFLTETESSLSATLGTYAQVNTFLGDTQDFFGTNISLESFSGKSQASDFFTTLSSGVGKALIVYDDPYFSPFEVSTYYDMGNSTGNLSVQYLSSGVTLPNTRATFVTDFTLSQQDNTLTVNQQSTQDAYAQVFKSNFSTPSGQTSLSSPEVRYPLADIAPLAYLQHGSNLEQAQEIVIYAESYSADTGYFISSNAIPGTIRVYRNGLLDSSYIYKPLTGEILFSSQPSSFDTIRITWLENSTTATDASLAAALGFTYNIFDNLRFISSVSTRWSFSENDYSSSGSSLPGTAHISTGIELDTEELYLKTTALATYEISDVTGTHRMLSMDDSQPQYIYLVEDSAVDLPDGFVPTLRDADGSTLEILSYINKDNFSVYTVSGSNHGIIGSVIDLEWNLMADEWAAQTIDLGIAVSQLQSAQQFSILLKNSTALPANTKVYLQLGVSSEEDFTYENTSAVRTWDITNQVDSYSSANTSLRQSEIRIDLNDVDRSVLSVNQNARIIVVYDSISTTTGTLSVGYAQLKGLSFLQTEGDKITVEQVPPPAALPAKVRFNENEINTALHLEWDWNTTSSAEITRFIPAVPLTSYNALTLYIYAEKPIIDSTVLIEFLHRTEDNPISTPVISYTLPLDTLTINTWQEISIPIPDIDEDELPTQVSITVSGTGAAEGSLYIDELIMQDAIPQYRVQNETELKWQKEVVIAQAGNFAILENPTIAIKSTLGRAFEQEEQETLLDARAEAGITIAKTELSGFIYKNQEENLPFASAGHSVRSLWPVFNIFEEYIYNADSKGTAKKTSAELAIQNAESQYRFSLISNSAFIQNYTRQESLISLEALFPVSTATYEIRSEFEAGQLNPDNTNPEQFNYSSAWTEASKIQFSTGYESAQERQTQARLFQAIRLPFANFSPQLDITAQSYYTSSTSNMHTDYTTSNLAFPFSIKNKQFKIFWKKTTGAEKTIEQGGNYFTDAQEYAKSLAGQSELLIPLPIADLFLDSVSQTMQSIIQEDNYLANSALLYESSYGLSFIRPSFYTIADIFVPSRVSAEFGKEILASSTEVSQNYKAEAYIGMSTYNVLGSLSAKPLFDWYEQDEFIQSHTVTLTYGDNFAKTYKIAVNSHITAGIYVNETDYFQSENSIHIQSDGSWYFLTGAHIYYSGTKSFIADLSILIRPSFAELAPMRIMRVDNLTYSISKLTDNDEYYQEIVGTHELITYLTEFASISAEAGISVALAPEYTVIQPRVSLSGKLEF